MRKIGAAFLAIALFLLTGVGMENVEKMRWYTQSVSLRYMEPLQSDIIRNAHKQNANLTFWCQQKVQLEIENHMLQVTALFYDGDVTIVWGQPLKIGTIPSRLDKSGCILSSGAAYALFGSENVVGLSLKQGKTTYTVRGVFENNDLLALLPASEAEFTAVEVPYTKEIWQDPDTQINVLLQSMGLPAPEWEIYSQEIFAIIQLTMDIPILFSAMILVLFFLRSMRGWSVGYRDGVIFLILLILTFALPYFFEVWPQWLTPSRWSDFSWWGQILNQLKNHFYAWLSVNPVCRDVCIKMNFLTHFGILAGQCILCEMLRCSLQKMEKILPPIESNVDQSKK